MSNSNDDEALVACGLLLLLVFGTAKSEKRRCQGPTGSNHILCLVAKLAGLACGSRRLKKMVQVQSENTKR